MSHTTTRVSIVGLQGAGKRTLAALWGIAAHAAHAPLTDADPDVAIVVYDASRVRSGDDAAWFAAVGTFVQDVASQRVVWLVGTHTDLVVTEPPVVPASILRRVSGHTLVSCPSMVGVRETWDLVQLAAANVDTSPGAQPSPSPITPLTAISTLSPLSLSTAVSPSSPSSASVSSVSSPAPSSSESSVHVTAFDGLYAAASTGEAPAPEYRTCCSIL
jgi:hypothetical protein